MSGQAVEISLLYQRKQPVDEVILNICKTEFKTSLCLPKILYFFLKENEFILVYYPFDFKRKNIKKREIKL